DVLAHGLLLYAAPLGWGEDGLDWFVEILGEKLGRYDDVSNRDGQGGRERLLLTAIINAVTDPILLTDVEGKLLIANARAEKLFTAPDDTSEGRRRAVAMNSMLFSAALASRAMEHAEPTRYELALVDPIEGSDLLFELLSTPVRDPSEGSAVVSILRNVT